MDFLVVDADVDVIAVIVAADADADVVDSSFNDIGAARKACCS